jgi:hypothetical protein
LQYHDEGRLPAVKQQSVDMTLNGSGVRDIVRVLDVSSATAIDVLKKNEPAVKQVNESLLKRLDPERFGMSPRRGPMMDNLGGHDMASVFGFHLGRRYQA